MFDHRHNHHMGPIIVLVLLATLFVHPFSVLAEPPNQTSKITVVGAVYCDACLANIFSRHSYFLQGVDVRIQCTFKAKSPKTAEQITFSVNRTTDRYGIYKLEVPNVDGVDCVDGVEIESLCRASLIRSSSAACDVPGLKQSTNQISVKSKQENLCIYSLNALSYKPSKKSNTLCGNHKEELQNSFNSSKCFLPFFPPFGIPWPHLSIPPLPPLPFPPLPPFPFPHLPFPNPPSLPFPFPPLPQYPPTPSLFHPPPPAFNLGDPRTWIPNIPSFSPPPPPVFNLRDPRTWIPYSPPSPPNKPQTQNP